MAVISRTVMAAWSLRKIGRARRSSRAASRLALDLIVEGPRLNGLHVHGGLGSQQAIEDFLVGHFQAEEGPVGPLSAIRRTQQPVEGPGLSCRCPGAPPG